MSPEKLTRYEPSLSTCSYALSTTLVLMPSRVYSRNGTRNHAEQSAISAAALRMARMRRGSRTRRGRQQSAASAQKSTVNIVLSRWLMKMPVIASASSGHCRSSRVSTSTIARISSGKKIIARLSPSVARTYRLAIR